MPWIQSLALFVVALLVRLASLSLHGDGRFFGKYVNGAAALARGELDGQRILDFSPLYLELHRALQWGGLGPLDIGALQCGVGAASCVLVGWIAFRWLGGAWGWVAGGLAAFHRDAIVYDQMLEPEVFFIFFTLLAFWLAIPDEQKGARRFTRAAAAGALAGLAIATRPSAWVFAPCLVLLVGIGAERRWDPHSLRRGVAFALALGACLAVVDLRNAAVGGGASMSPWQVFYTGNNPMASGMWREDFIIKELELQLPTDPMDRAHQVFRDVALAAGGPTDSPDDYWLSLSLRYLREYPSQAARLFGQKALGLAQPNTSFDFPLAREVAASLEAWPLWTPSLAFIFGLAGLAWKRGAWPVALMCGASAIVPLVFFVSSRYRLPLGPWLDVGAAGFLAVLVERARSAEGRGALALLAPIASLLPLAAMAYAPLAPGHYAASKQRAMREVAPAREEASRLRNRDLLVQAGAALREAVYPLPWRLARLREARIPFDLASIADEQTARAQREAERDDTPWAWLRVGVLLDHAGQSSRALEAYGRVVERAFWPGDRPLVTRAHVRAGKLLARQGHLAEAHRSFAAASELAPGAPEPLVGLFLTTDGEGHGAWLAEALRVNCEFDVHYAHGRMALDLGRPDDALEPLGTLVQRLPGFARARVLYAVALDRTGSRDLALLQTMLVQRERSPLLDPVYTPIEVVVAAAEREPDEREAWLRLTRFAALYGDYPLLLRTWRHLETQFALTPEELWLAGRSSFMHEDYERALPLLERAFDAMPDRQDVARTLSRARARATGAERRGARPPRGD